jgi:hypothetical protein
MMPFTWIFALTGAVQGWALWGLWKLFESKTWPATEPLVYTGLLYVALAVPLLIYCTQQVDELSPKVRRVALLCFGLLFAALGAATAWSAGVDARGLGVRFHDTLVAGVLGFVLLGLFCGFDFEARRWRYERLFYYAWRNGILLVTAAVMTGIFWGVLWAGAALMSLIGVKFVRELITQSLFNFTVTGLVVAASVGLGLVRADMTETIRRYALSIAAWLLPLVLFFAVLWAVALPFTGLDPLFKTRYAAKLMLCFMALAVLFANCAYQDGEHEAYPDWLARALQGAWLALLVVVAVAWWALGLRVAQYGWSEDRLWAALVAALAAVYALGYALSWLKRERWMQTMGMTNIAAALLLCVGLLVYVAPPTHVRKLAVAAHLAHVQQAVQNKTGEKTPEPDWNYLRWESGRYGREALQALAAGQGAPAGLGWERKAERLLAETNRYNPHPEKQMNANELAQKFRVSPQGRSLPESFAQYIRGGDKTSWELRHCLQLPRGCNVWMGDLDGDARDELLVFANGWNGAVYVQTGQTDQGWRHAGNFSVPGAKGSLDAAELDRAQIVPPQWKDLQIQGQHLRVQVQP